MFIRKGLHYQDAADSPFPSIEGPNL